MIITIKNLTKLSFNTYNHLHWAKKKAFKDNLRVLVMVATRQRYTGGYKLNFSFTFKGRRLDTINVVHYCKIIEDALFRQDKENREITINVYKGKENKCSLKLTKII